MEPSAATTTPSPSEWHCSPKVKRQRNAAAQPFGDVTNLRPRTPTNPTTSRPRPLPSDTTAAVSTCSASPSVTPVSKPSSASAAEERSLVKSPISTVYTRRKTTEKTRANGQAPFPAGTSSCPPPAVARTNRKTSMTQGTRPVSSSAPCHRSKKKKSTRMENLPSGKLILPEDFVKKQRAYFEEVDAFELPEEEASETDLE